MFSPKSQALLVSVLFLFCFYSKVSCFVNARPKRAPPASEFDGETDGPLYLTPLIRAQKFDEAKQLAKVKNFKIEMIAQSYSGFLTVDDRFKSNLFFWYIPAKENPKNASVVLWLQGGPGVSSMEGLFYENGPFIIKNGELREREYSWHKNHHLIYIDNPVGTGFSFTENQDGYSKNAVECAKNLYEAMKQFFTLFSELQSNKFFITGESYGGKYVPALAYKIYKQDKNDQPSINLAGLAIGNGWSDPINQMKYGEMLYQTGLIDLHTLEDFKRYQELATAFINDGYYAKALDVLNTIIHGEKNSLFINVTGLDSTLNYVHPSNYDSIDNLGPFFNSSAIRNAIHVGNKPFNINSEKVWDLMADDIMASIAPWICELLTQYPIYVFSGQLDIIIAPVLTENYLLHLEFNEAAEFRTQKRIVWHVDKQVAGYYRQAGNLTEFIIRNAGHMVPMDQPKWTLKMLTNLTYP